MNGRVGYRFHPTDEELIDYFLRHKINGTLHCDDVLLIDVCKFDPWDLPKYAAQGSNEEEWYFFHKRELKNRNTSKPRYNRSTITGHWKPTGKVRPVKTKYSRMEIGVKKTLVFYKYAEPNKELKTNWVIHEYEPKAFPSYQADLVLCKLKEKAADKAETSACREAESSRRGPSGFDVLPAELPFSQVDQQLLQTLFPSNGMNFHQPYTLQPQIQIDEGVSIDDLELSDDIFQSGSNGFTYQFETNELQPDPNEMDVSFFSTLADSIGYNLEESASNAHTHLNHSSSARSQSGIYLDEIADLDSDDFYAMSSQFGDSSLKNGHTSSKQYRQMQSVQSLTETLPAPKTLERHEEISSMRKASKGSPILVEAHTRSGNNKVEVKMAAGKSQIQVKLSGPSESKARETRKHGTDLNLRCNSPKEKISLKTERDHKMITAETVLKSISGTDKICSSINTETSMLYQRSVPVSVYIINLSIGLVLFVAAIRDLLVLH